MSALAPVPAPPRVATPSKSPIEPSTTARSGAPRPASSAAAAAAIQWAICPAPIAQLSRFSDRRPAARA